MHTVMHCSALVTGKTTRGDDATASIRTAFFILARGGLLTISRQSVTEIESAIVLERSLKIAYSSSSTVRRDHSLV